MPLKWRLDSWSGLRWHCIQCCVQISHILLIKLIYSWFERVARWQWKTRLLRCLVLLLPTFFIVSIVVTIHTLLCLNRSACSLAGESFQIDRRPRRCRSFQSHLMFLLAYKTNEASKLETRGIITSPHSHD